MNRTVFLLAAFTAFTSLTVVAPANVAMAHPFSFISQFVPLGVDVHPHECDKCGQVHDADGPCIERQAVTECVIGKKEIFKSKIRCEYVSVPETRYYWKKVRLTKEIPCPYCKPVCKTEDRLHCFGREYWEKSLKTDGKSHPNGADSCCDSPQGAMPDLCAGQGEGSSSASCVEVHCKTIRPTFEKVPSKRCSHEPGETTITVHYRSCVKVPYTVYRQVKVPVCVKQPRYKKVKVSITKYVCTSCRGLGCSRCSSSTGSCSSTAGCSSSTGSCCDGPSSPGNDSYPEDEILSPDDETPTHASESSLPISVTKAASLLWGSGLRQE